jgi:hypothetical protein
MRATVLVLFVLVPVVLGSDIVREAELAEDGVVPGLGDVAEGGAGMGPELSRPTSSSWEGGIDVNPSWNRQFLQNRETSVASKKRSKLALTIQLQKNEIEKREEEEEKQLRERDELIKQMGEKPIDDIVIPEHEVYDGYVSDALLDPKKSDDCTDTPDDAALPMTGKNPIPPPQLERAFPTSSQGPVPPTALTPVVSFPTVRDFGEDGADINLHDTLEEESTKDLRTPMDPSRFQHWSLRSTSPDGLKLTSLTTTATSTASDDVVGRAQKTAKSILKSTYAGQEEVENPEGGLDLVTAWGVMNSRGENELETDGVNMPEEMMYTPSPSAEPSPSHAPREVYLQDGTAVSRELYERSFAGQEGLSGHETMGEKDEEVTDPVIEVMQPVLPRVQRTYTGRIPHARAIDPVKSSTGLLGMGGEVQKVQEKGSSLENLLIQTTATAMKNAPGLKK